MEDARKKTFRTILRWLAVLSPAVLAVILLKVCKAFPLYTELVHARIVYPVFASVLSFLNRGMGFSVTEVLAFGAIPLLVGIVLALVRYIRRSGDRVKAVGKVARGITLALSSVFLLYMIMHGVNFYRAPMSVLYGLDMSPKTPEQLVAVVTSLGERASRLRSELSEDEDGIFRLREGKADCLGRADEALAAARERHPLLKGNGSRPKWVLASGLWSYTGITGFYMMPLCEPNINVDQPDFCIPFTVAHELSHTCGFAREDEANFAAYLLCTASDDPEYAYSGTLMAYIYCANALFDYDLDLWAEARNSLSEAVIRDLADQREYWDRHEGFVREASTGINDTFLKAQGQEDGVLSYDRVVALILAEKLKK